MAASASDSGAARSSVSLRVANSRSPSAAGAGFESSLAIAALPATKWKSGRGMSSLYVPLLWSAAGRAGLPQDIAPALSRDVAGGDEEIVRKAVEVDQRER